MSVDQVRISMSSNNILKYHQIIPEESNEIENTDIISKNKQISDREYTPSIFHTHSGYRGGYILSKNDTTYEVLFTRDEFGNLIHEIGNILITKQMFPVRKNLERVWILTSIDIKAEGYIKIGENIDIGLGIGAGINSINDSGSGSGNKRKLKKYPIYNPLTIHNRHHRDTLTYASSFILQLINEYFQTGQISSQFLEQARWLVNVVLVIDNYQALSENVFLEALTNFCLDYLILSPGTLLRQPINYIFDILGIDGIYSKGHLSVSYIPTQLEFVEYHTIS